MPPKCRTVTKRSPQILQLGLGRGSVALPLQPINPLKSLQSNSDEKQTQQLRRKMFSNGAITVPSRDLVKYVIVQD
jgi:hypothetical protein